MKRDLKVISLASAVAISAACSACYEDLSQQLAEPDDEQTLFSKYTGLNTSLVASIVVSSDYFLESCSNSVVVGNTVQKINTFLTSSGVPKKSLLTTDEFVLSVLTIFVTLTLYYFLMGKRHVKKRNRLAADLKLAQTKVRNSYDPRKSLTLILSFSTVDQF